ncbi:MAG: YbaB/EbfC family nucleoid-associated protein [Vampirovibrionales bacterium]|nr:YbaB/EbfC family nucleoid-associated protein [Vampirovibrionales bacterium]
MFDIQKMMKQAQKMQEKMQRMQEEMGEMEIQGSAGGGAIVITSNAKLEFRSVTVQAEALGDRETLEDLILTALRDLNAKAEKITKEKMDDVTAGMPLPPGMKLPF